MEHWQKVTIGTIGGIIATFVFYFFVGKLLDYCYIKKKKRPHHEVHPRPERFYAKPKNNIMNAELERFVHEEFESSRHECVVVVGCTDTRSVGICAFLQDMTIEYFVETFPECCLQHFSQSFVDKDGKKDEAGLSYETSLRTVLTAVSAWSPKWEMADSINFLSPNERFVIESNNSESHAAKFLKQFEEKYEFKIYSQWTDNFVPDHYANEEMWEGLIVCVKKLLREDRPKNVWSDFVCEQWHRTQIHVNGVNFHQLPHPGHVSPDKPKVDEKLVDI